MNASCAAVLIWASFPSLAATMLPMKANMPDRIAPIRAINATAIFVSSTN
nr:MAG TPA_asm: hypothetical protein [Caudoviricetes sp.]DAM18234.1 MAG TPA: hypothetical protein [Caudoviricetes sp.]DAS89504.1 MAG TPA: hypothetical protein [Caudoviricetes sp.]